MAGPSVAVRVIGDLSNFAKSMGDTATHGESAASRLRGAFTGAIGAFNQTGVLGPFGDALNGVDQALGSIIEHGKNIGPAMMGAGTAIAGVGAGLTALGSKDQAAHQQLQQSVEATGKAYDDYGDQVEKAIGHQEKYGNTANETQDALRVMTQAFQDPQKALDELGTASDLAAAKHEDLTTAAGQLAKAANGSGRILKELGISQKDAAGNAKSHDEILKEISERLSGQASASADTFTGKLKGLKATVEDNVSAFAQKYGPAITVAGTAMAGLGAAIQVVNALHVASVAGWLADAAAAAAAAVAENVALLGIPIAIAAVVAGIAWMIFHWQQVKNAVMDAWTWIADHWPLLLAILLGPIGIAVDLIIANFDRIKGFVADVVGFVQAVWGGLVGFFQGLVATIAGIVSGIGDALAAPFRWAHDEIIRICDDITNAISKITGPISTVTGAIGGALSHIPGLQHGGIVTRPTLAVVGEAGPEAVIPLNRVVSGAGAAGPAVVIENATFAQQMDVDLFMQRVAWHAQTSLV